MIPLQSKHVTGSKLAVKMVLQSPEHLLSCHSTTASLPSRNFYICNFKMTIIGRIGNYDMFLAYEGEYFQLNFDLI